MFNFFLHHKKSYEITTFIACIIYTPWLAFAVMFLEAHLAEAIVIILIIILTMILCQDKGKILVMATSYSILICAGSSYYLQSINESILMDDNPFENIIIFIVVSIAIVLVMVLYQNGIKSMSNHREQLIFGLENKNNELERFA